MVTAGAGHTKKELYDTQKATQRGGMPLRRLWPVDNSHQGRDTSEETAAHGRIHARAEEMSKKEGAVKEKSKKQGVAKNPAAH